MSDVRSTNKTACGFWRRIAVAAWRIALLVMIFLWLHPVSYRSTVAYEGTKYLWGGENRFGIDCSGLVRRGLIDACLRQGMSTLNPGLIRQSFLMRWFDCSARALQEEYRGQTHRLFRAPSIRKLDHDKLEPGDFAVTAGGVHTLAYLGEKTWIEADPGAGHVIKVRATDENGWLVMPIDVIRWRVFENETPGHR